uniref:Photosystem II 11 kDa protein n=1 Tax=Aureoumbra lagunensis TaxID=44058 RepID=A0A7S3NKQ6_9STRA|mmetsp:Transcript_23469/g.30490  ORF Transcript_23469/g.30490 Transcript_23469/m.30490 type:complete len:184 (+) Transcript_23469:69-620(+)
MMRASLLLFVLPLGAEALSLVPSKAVSANNVNLDRREMFSVCGALGVACLADRAVADDEATPVAPPAPVVAELPTNYGITQDYYTDAAKVVAHMRLATSLDKGSPNIEQIAIETKKEMNAFVAFYRRFTTVTGKQSFSTLYTAINVLAGHYTSYGPKFPVPEKRRKRLYQEYDEIEKNIKRKR